MKCIICNTNMIEKKWKIDFLVEDERFVSVLNYPLNLCPFCGHQDLKKTINERVLKKLSEKENFQIKASAIKFEEAF
ncbi:MAG: hypothetical protein OEV44_07350 [Spirochaetota bacterium]|nr:hypothetical protein [Spirochaetota bacterium]